ncbi:hypothetical protein CJF30_00008263 [Rutstroemia sp. NJR-2017a BBW]|nr:hypothetical protein CJF30_00008263 [Rutstroemia sp. NJR-2017a BBW]
MSSHIDYHRFRNGESCIEEGCRARKFYIEDGKKFCQRGHEQTGFTQTQQDEDDWNSQGKKSRKRKEENEHMEKVFGGQDATDLYLQCYQLILWKQTHWLVTVKKFPPELETVVRDLWDLRLRVLHGAGDERTEYGTEFGSTTEGETTDTDATGWKSLASSIMSRKRAERTKKLLPKLVETLAGFAIKITDKFRRHHPMGNKRRDALHTSSENTSNFGTWELGNLLISLQIKEIPKEMKVRLPAHYHSALEIHSPLNAYRVHQSVLEMITFYNVSFEMVFPPLNHRLLLYKFTRDLGLPVDIYVGVKCLAELLGYDFSYPIHNRRLYGTAGYPEFQLMSLVVIATKLSQPFDDVVRLPENDLDPSATKIDWIKWRGIMTEHTDETLERGDELCVTDSDVLNMTGKQMDEWMNWYHRTWIDDRDQKMPEQILELFPLETQPERDSYESTTSPSERTRQIHQTMTVQKPHRISEDDNTEDVVRPGEMYRRYRKVGELPDFARTFYEVADWDICGKIGPGCLSYRDPIGKVDACRKEKAKDSRNGLDVYT